MISSSKDGDSRKFDSSYLTIGYDSDIANAYYYSLNEFSVWFIRLDREPNDLYKYVPLDLITLAVIWQ